MGTGTPIWTIEGVALDSTGDEVAGSLGAVVKAIQTTQTSDSADITAIKAVTDVIPDAGAMTSIAQEATLAVPAADAAANADWGDVIGNKEDVASRTADVVSLVGLARKILEEATEIDHHFHNVERWWGAVAVPDETNAISANVDTPFAATSGNNTWGTAIPILGTADDPTPSGESTFDPHRVVIVDLDDDTTLWRLRFIYGYGTSGDAITAGQWTEVPVIANAVPGNRAGGGAEDVKMIVLDVGIKMWAQSWNQTNGEVLQFQWGSHAYPHPSAPTPP